MVPGIDEQWPRRARGGIARLLVLGRSAAVGEVAAHRYEIGLDTVDRARRIPCSSAGSSEPVPRAEMQVGHVEDAR